MPRPGHERGGAPAYAGVGSAAAAPPQPPPLTPCSSVLLYRVPSANLCRCVNLVWAEVPGSVDVMGEGAFQNSGCPAAAYQPGARICNCAACPL